MQSVSITTQVVSLNTALGEVYSIQHYVIKFVSDLRQVSGFIRVLRFPPAINLTAWRYSWNIVECGVKHHNPNPLFCQITNYHVIRIYKNIPIAEIKQNKDASKQFDLSWWPFNFLMTCKSENVRNYGHLAMNIHLHYCLTLLIKLFFFREGGLIFHFLLLSSIMIM